MTSSVRHNILSLAKRCVVQADCFLIYFILCEWMLAYTRALKILQYSTAKFVNYCLIWKANFYGRGDISCWNCNIIQSFFFKKVTPFLSEYSLILTMFQVCSFSHIIPSSFICANVHQKQMVCHISQKYLQNTLSTLASNNSHSTVVNGNDL